MPEMEVIRHLEKKHAHPAKRTGIADSDNSEMRDENKGENDSERGLYECAKQCCLHLAHPAEKALDAVCEGREYIKEGHREQIALSFRNDRTGALPSPLMKRCISTLFRASTTVARTRK